MKIKYYGTRGSIPTPGADTVKYGGNTSCVSIQTETDLIILDAGSGLRLLGIDLMDNGQMKGDGHCSFFFSHVHWDHIQGIPFFLPAYIKGNCFDFYGSPNVDTSMQDVLVHQQQFLNFPIEFGEMPVTSNFSALKDGETVKIGSAEVTGKKLQHPGGVFAYRVEEKGKSIVYATDTEHYSVLDWRLVELAKGADILIYDCNFTPEEYETNRRIGWGHSTYEEGIKVVKEAGVKEFHMFHHDPLHSDDFLEKEILEPAKKLFPNSHLAREGWEFEL